MLRGVLKKKVRRRNQFTRIKRSRISRVQRARGEPGYVDKTVNTTMDATGSIQLIATIPQGAGTKQRVGKKITLTSMQMRGYIYNNTAAALNDVAYMIVYDKRPTGAMPLITAILNDTKPSAMNNDDNASRFQILKRVDAMLIGNTGSPETLTTAAAKSADWWLSLKNRPCEFGSLATGAIGDITTGALYLVSVGNNATGTTAASLAGWIRVKYNDA